MNQPPRSGNKILYIFDNQSSRPPLLQKEGKLFYALSNSSPMLKLTRMPLTGLIKYIVISSVSQGSKALKRNPLRYQPEGIMNNNFNISAKPYGSAATVLVNRVVL